jgi:hypothetical protein
VRLPVYHVDAFARRAFKGNPAPVVILEDWLPHLPQTIRCGAISQGCLVSLFQRSMSQEIDISAYLRVPRPFGQFSPT